MGGLTERPDFHEEHPTHAYVGGPAGTGKSFLVRGWAEKYDGITLCTTTGISAVNLGEGVTTINALLGYYDTASLQDLWTQGYLSSKLMRLWQSGLRHIVLDEVSMLDAEQLTIMSLAVQEINQRLEGQGGRLGLTLTGDFCFGKGTRVMLADGSLRVVEEIKVGDRVMGVDFTPREVMRTTSGLDQLYEVRQANGETYVVNSTHLLVLKRGKNGERREWEGQRYPGRSNDAQYMNAPELMSKSAKFREVFVGYKVGCVPLPPRKVTVNPYFLGLWLGDGESDAPRICTADQEVVDYCEEYAARLGLKCSKRPDGPGKALRISITTGRSYFANNKNVLWKALQELQVVGDKHIPEDYLLNNEEARLALLAGLIDSDGSWSGNRYLISQKRERLARQVKQLADGLGFRTGLRSGRTKLHGKTFPYWTVSIGGDTWRVPCKVERKKSRPRPLGRDRLTSVLTVKPLAIGEYYGFEVVGPDRLFLLADGTVVHNCQLPPVKAPFAFESDAWGEYDANKTMLTKFWRQTDPNFLAALQDARRGQGARAAEYFEPFFQLAQDPDYPSVTLLAKNDGVDRFNLLRLSKVPGEKVAYTSSRWGKPRPEWKQIPERLDLKVGALVMVLANQKEYTADGEPTGDYDYVNGDLGELVDDTPVVKLRRTGKEKVVLPVRRDTLVPLEPGRRKELVAQGKGNLIVCSNISCRTCRDGEGEKCKNARFEIAGQITYVPLRLAWATTVHKSQGLTLDQVQVDFRDRFFESPGMLYVALSRVRSPEGLRLVGREDQFVKRCRSDAKVGRWL